MIIIIGFVEVTSIQKKKKQKHDKLMNLTEKHGVVDDVVVFGIEISCNNLSLDLFRSPTRCNTNAQNQKLFCRA